jgi:tRNA modification GTPase
MVQVVVTDTAGLRETRDVIEAEGVSRAKQAASNADIVIAVADVGAPDFDDTLLQWTDLLNPGARHKCA